MRPRRPQKTPFGLSLLGALLLNVWRRGTAAFGPEPFPEARPGQEASRCHPSAISAGTALSEGLEEPKAQPPQAGVQGEAVRAAQGPLLGMESCWYHSAGRGRRAESRSDSSLGEESDDKAICPETAATTNTSGKGQRPGRQFARTCPGRGLPGASSLLLGWQDMERGSHRGHRPRAQKPRQWCDVLVGGSSKPPPAGNLRATSGLLHLESRGRLRSVGGRTETTRTLPNSCLAPGLSRRCQSAEHCPSL